MWFEIRFQIDLNLHSKVVWKFVWKIERNFLLPPLLLACWSAPPHRPSSDCVARLSFVRPVFPTPWPIFSRSPAGSPAPHRRFPLPHGPAAPRSRLTARKPESLADTLSPPSCLASVWDPVVSHTSYLHRLDVGLCLDWEFAATPFARALACAACPEPHK